MGLPSLHRSFSDFPSWEAEDGADCAVDAVARTRRKAPASVASVRLILDHLRTEGMAAERDPDDHTGVVTRHASPPPERSVRATSLPIFLGWARPTQHENTREDPKRACHESDTDLNGSMRKRGAVAGGRL